MEIRQVVPHVSQLVLSYLLCLDYLISQHVVVFFEVAEVILQVDSLFVELPCKLVDFSVFLLEHSLGSGIFLLSFVEGLHMGSFQGLQLFKVVVLESVLETFHFFSVISFVILDFGLQFLVLLFEPQQFIVGLSRHSLQLICIVIDFLLSFL